MLSVIDVSAGSPACRQAGSAKWKKLGARRPSDNFHFAVSRRT